MPRKTAFASLEARVMHLAMAGRYQTPEGNYYSARLRYITDGDDRALTDMVRSVTLTVPDLDELD